MQLCLVSASVSNRATGLRRISTTNLALVNDYEFVDIREFILSCYAITDTLPWKTNGLYFIIAYVFKFFVFLTKYGSGDHPASYKMGTGFLSQG
jgi:hypothetical protein